MRNILCYMKIHRGLFQTLQIMWPQWRRLFDDRSVSKKITEEVDP